MTARLSTLLVLGAAFLGMLASPASASEPRVILIENFDSND